MASSAILSNFFEEQWTQNHPQYLLGLSRVLFFPTTFLEIAVYVKNNCVQYTWYEVSFRLWENHVAIKYQGLDPEQWGWWAAYEITPLLSPAALMLFR